MTHKEARDYIEKMFPEKADQSLVIEVNEENMLGIDMSFSKFYHKYQEKHRLKYGSYLQIEIPN